jgi:hypothetical protein
MKVQVPQYVGVGISLLAAQLLALDSFWFMDFVC